MVVPVSAFLLVGTVVVDVVDFDVVSVAHAGRRGCVQEEHLEQKSSVVKRSAGWLMVCCCWILKKVERFVVGAFPRLFWPCLPFFSTKASKNSRRWETSRAVAALYYGRRTTFWGIRVASGLYVRMRGTTFCGPLRCVALLLPTSCAQ